MSNGTLIYIADVNHITILNSRLNKPLLGDVEDIVRFSELILNQKDLKFGLDFATDEGHNVLHFGIFGNFLFSRIATKDDVERVSKALEVYI